MSWHYLAEQAGESLEDICSDGVPLPPLRSKITHAAFYSNGKLTASYLDSLSGTTCKPSTQNRGEAKSMSSAEDFRVRTSVAQGKVRASLEHEAAYGVKWHESFAKWDRDSSSWRTHQCSLFGGLESFSETWPRWGMMRDGVSSERVMQEHRTSETGSGLWPTPCARDFKGPNTKASLTRKDGKSRMDQLQNAVVHGGTKTQRTWPTPKAHDPKSHSSNMEYHKKRSGKMMDLTCDVMVSRGKPAQLNPSWVEWLMGWPIGWTGLKPLATAKCQLVRHSHGVSCQDNN